MDMYEDIMRKYADKGLCEICIYEDECMEQCIHSNGQAGDPEMLIRVVDIHKYKEANRDD